MNNSIDKSLESFDFAEYLLSETSNYRGQYKEVIVFTSQIFRLTCDLIYIERLSRLEKNLLYKSVAYFILPRDIFSESIHGVKGFIDDLMLCLYALNLIKDRHGNDLLFDLWDGKPSDLKELLNVRFQILIKENKDMFNSVLHEVGEDEI